MTEKEVKEISYYHNLVKAWFTTALIRDCLVSIFSIVCIFIHLHFNTLISNIGVVICLFVMYFKYIVYTNKKWRLHSIVGSKCRT